MGRAASGDSAGGAANGRECTCKPPPSFVAAVQIRGRNRPFYLSLFVFGERKRKSNQYVLRESPILGQFKVGAICIVGEAFAGRSIRAEILFPLCAANSVSIQIGEMKVWNAKSNSGPSMETSKRNVSDWGMTYVGLWRNIELAIRLVANHRSNRIVRFI